MGLNVKRKSDHIIYLDSCIYIAYYRNEVSSYGKSRIDAIAGLLEENENGGTTIVTSSLTICEVIECLKQYKLDKEIEDFRNRFKFGLHKLKDVDPKVSERAAMYRHHYRMNPVRRPNRPKPFTNLTTPDAIHLATATLYQCNDFWTFDGQNPTADKHESIKPLWLNNKVGNDSIIITPPSMPQGVLPLIQSAGSVPTSQKT
jgi:predicted nucleic acid-binding protein